MFDVQADLCYASAFDDTEARPSETASDDDASLLSLETLAVAAAESNIVTEVTRGMTEVASAPSLLTMSANVNELPFSEALSDMSLTDGNDDRPLTSTAGDGKPQMDNAFYFYQGERVQYFRFSLVLEQ